MVRSIAVMSMGPGTGKTMLALNLALALHKQDHKVLVFDADFTKKNMLEHLDIQDIPVNLGHVFSGDAHIKDAIYRHVSGMKVLASIIHEQDYGKLDYHYQDLLGDYDYIILDTPYQYGHLETTLRNADEAIIVHSPEYSSKNVMDAISLLNRLKVLNLGIVLNKFSEDSVDEMFKYPVLEKIPAHKDIAKSLAHKNPLLHIHPKSRLAPKFNRLAGRLS